LFAPCYHCENPVCIQACKNQAIYKEEKYGAVLVNQEKCQGDRKCLIACPYGTPQFQGDNVDAKMSKCTMCIDRLDEGNGPICVESCPMRALDFGPLKDLFKKYGNTRDIEDIPRSNITKPAVFFKPNKNKEKIIPYDEKKAIGLLASDDDIKQLSSLYLSKTEIVRVPLEIVGRNRLTMKARSSKAIKCATKHDE
jgi:anaerobic dimethyl sulfoxide reductase subunit B (iron-sulfur subunit)